MKKRFRDLVIFENIDDFPSSIFDLANKRDTWDGSCYYTRDGRTDFPQVYYDQGYDSHMQLYSCNIMTAEEVDRYLKNIEKELEEIKNLRKLLDITHTM